MFRGSYQTNLLEENVALIRPIGARSVTLTERNKLEWSSYGNYSQNISLTGTCAPEELDKLIPTETLIAASTFNRFTFRCGLHKGEQFPSFEAIQRIGYPGK